MPGGRVSAAAEPAMWATFIAELWRWVADHGGRVVPTTTVTIVKGLPFNLGSRVKNARVYYHRGSLTPEQIIQLDAIPGWSWNGHHANSRTTWQKHIAALHAYAATHGNLADLEHADPSLAKWLQTQRSRDLTPDQRAELAAIPRALDEPTYFLDRLIADLTRWIHAVPGRDASHLLRSTTIVDADGRLVRLGQRAANCRRRYRQGHLTDREVQRFSTVPGWSWELRSPGRRSRDIERLAKS